MPQKARTLTVFGSTGSIGTQTLQVLADAKSCDDLAEIELFAIVANGSVDILVEQVRRHRPSVVGIADVSRYKELKGLLAKESVEVLCGDEIYDLARQSDLVMNAVTGFAGVPVTEAALTSGGRLANANKESIVAAGDLVEPWRIQGESELIPVDSEHSAIYQVLGSSELANRSLKRLVITASGGPFRGYSQEELEAVTLQDALEHPTWRMGPKNTIDSSTLANKGLEVIEAHYLFAVPYDQIEVVVHPQSVVHSMVEYSDGTVLAQLSMPDMKLPISLSLYHPQRSLTPYGAMNWREHLSLEFFPPDHERFPALELAYEAGKLGSGGTCWFNASNEIAVESFISGALAWKEVAKLLELSMDRYEKCNIWSVEDVISIDRRAREVARTVVEEIS